LTPLDSALIRLGRAVLRLLHPRLAERAATADEDEGKRVAEEVDRLADLLTRLRRLRLEPVPLGKLRQFPCLQPVHRDVDARHEPASGTGDLDRH
jgi:hypothetical protein